MNNKKIYIIITVACILLLIFFTATPVGVSCRNNWFYSIQKVDDVTNYNTLRQVEDTCRYMIVSYNSDVLIYQQYKDSTNPKEQEWAEMAKIRANKTASQYNNYILKNNYIWKDNIPTDIYLELPYID